jgi:hypothetical protein
LTGEADLFPELAGSQKEEFILRRPVDVPVLDADEAETAGPVAPAPGADPDARGVEDIAQGAPWGERDLALVIVAYDNEFRHNKIEFKVQSSKFKVRGAGRCVL